MQITHHWREEDNDFENEVVARAIAEDGTEGFGHAGFRETAGWYPVQCGNDHRWERSAHEARERCVQLARRHAVADCKRTIAEAA